MRRRIFPSLLAAVSILCCAAAAGDKPQKLAIKAGKVWTVSDGVIENGLVLVDGGKIRAVRKAGNVPGGYKVLDVPDGHVVPGLIDAHCHIGLSANIFAEMDETILAVAPEMQILDAFNPLADDVNEALRSGVTTVLLAPGERDAIGGQTAVVKLHPDSKGNWVLKRNSGLKFSLRDRALMYDRRPTSRAGLMALIRERLDEAKAREDESFDPQGEVLKSVVDGNLPAYVCAHTVDEIAGALTIIDEYGLDAVLVGAEQGDEIADMIAGRKLPVIYSPLLAFSRDKDLRRAGKIGASGVKLAFSSAAPRTSLDDLRTSAILAAKYGLDAEVALKSLTIDAAEILGVAKRVGSIKVGKDADLVIFNGEPLDAASGVETVIINGSIVYQRQEE